MTADARAPLPVILVGAGTVGLTTALGLDRYDIPYALFEEDDRLSVDTKAGTILTRTLEVFRRYGIADEVLQHALRVEEIGDIDRATNQPRLSVHMDLVREDTRYPFVINLPQHHLEPILGARVAASPRGRFELKHRLVGLRQFTDHVAAEFETEDGRKIVEGSYLLACDGGRSTVRQLLDIPMNGTSLDVLFMLVDVKVDLDVKNPRDYPYLAYFSDPAEWMILIRHPHCWRFLFPLAAEAAEPSLDELRAKVLRFIGETNDLEIIGKVVYRVHHRIAERWRDGRVFLMGDAAHLVTPMWALGLNTGILDASNLPWRLAWVLRGWAAECLLDGYAREQQPIAAKGSGEMAEAARHYMSKEVESVKAMTDNQWGNAYTRSLLSVCLDVDGTGAGSMIKSEMEPLHPGDRLPDRLVHGPDGREHRLHDLIDGEFLALYFADVRRRPDIPRDAAPGLRHRVVSRWDAPLDSGLRDRALLDPGDALLRRVGCAADTLVLVRPDEHVAAMVPMRPGLAEELYRRIIGQDG